MQAGNHNRKMGYEQYNHELLTMTTMLDTCHSQQCYVERYPHPPAQPFNNTDTWMESGEGRSCIAEVRADIIERGGCGVASGLDRRRVDVVVDDVDQMPARDVLAFQVLLLKAASRWSTTSGIQQHNISGTRTSQQWQLQNGSASNTASMSDT